MEIIQYTILTISSTCNLALLFLSRFIREKGVPIKSHPSNIFGSMGLAYPESGGNETPKIISICCKNIEKVV